MRQFLLPRRISGDEELITLSGKDFHYLTRVLRLREGNEVPAVDASGAGFTMRLARIERTSCTVTLRPSGADGTHERFDGLPALTLMQCLPKPGRMDLIVRQAAEAGVMRIVPLLSEHALDTGGRNAARIARWERIAREALQQSGNPRLIAIDEPRSLEQVCARPGDWGTTIFFHEQPLEECSLHELLAPDARAVSILIGPEGGLAPKEVALLRQSGFRPAWLGPAILRVETAAIFAIGAVKTILQERKRWTPSRAE
jgi:16S rRNA (uracil1498-N3)-methyltransferase